MDEDSIHPDIGPMDEDNFQHSGPKHMMSPDSKIITADWGNEEHRRCVTACLVKATSVLENDRIKCRIHNKALAPAWWESFGFELKKTFKDDSNKNDQLTYGAIFENNAPDQHMAPDPHRPSAPVSVPKYVVAFRGTMLSHPKAPEELAQNLLVIFNALADFERFKRAHLDVNSLIGDLGNDSCSFWLAGHSLGASLALQIGRDMMLEKNLNVPTFLFNPPHVSLSPAINGVLGGTSKTLLYAASYMFKFAFAQVLPSYRKRTKELFEKLTPWVPELYVHRKDFICVGYIEYFEQGEQLVNDHPRWTRTAERVSYRDMFFSVFGNKNVQPHLLPSARVWTNSSEDREDAHALRQWWKPYSEPELTNKRYSDLRAVEAPNGSASA